MEALQHDLDSNNYNSVQKLFNIFLLDVPPALINGKYAPKLNILYKYLINFLKSYKKDFEQLKSCYARNHNSNDREIESRITYMLRKLTENLDKSRDIIYEALIISIREIINQW